MQPGQMAYDRAITVFSPDGRLFQVEYARESVRRGTATAGVVYKDGVVLVADRRIANPKLAESSSVEKIHKVDDHIGAATAGLVADARVLVDYARLTSQINRVTYNEPISLEMLVRAVCDYKQQYTQFGGVRPFGTALLIGGCDDTGIHLFETDPSGSLTSFKASSIGGNRAPVMELFEQRYRVGMEADEAILLALEGLQQSMEEPGNLSSVEICTIDTESGFRRLPADEIAKYVARLPSQAKPTKG